MSIHLVSDDLIDSGATLYATEHDYASIEQAYERGAKSLRDIYEAELQSMRERLSRMESRDVELIGHLRTMKADADHKRSKCLTSGHKRDAESLAALSEMFTKLIEWLKPLQQVAP